MLQHRSGSFLHLLFRRDAKLPTSLSNLLNLNLNRDDSKWYIILYQSDWFGDLPVIILKYFYLIWYDDTLWSQFSHFLASWIDFLVLVSIKRVGGRKLKINWFRLLVTQIEMSPKEVTSYFSILDIWIDLMWVSIHLTHACISSIGNYLSNNPTPKCSRFSPNTQMFEYM